MIFSKRCARLRFRRTSFSTICFRVETSGDQWTLTAFRNLFEACAGRAAELFTYTCATANRVALLAAGFYVARGRNAGEKLETTIAFTPAAIHAPSANNREFLGDDWLEKWNRSRAKFPEEVQEAARPLFEQQIRSHPQFRRAD